VRCEQLHQLYQFRIDFKQPVKINSVDIVGLGDYTSGGNAAVLRLLNANSQPLATLSTTYLGAGFCSPQAYSLNANGVTGTTFFIDEFDYSTTSAYRSHIGINFTPVNSTALAIAPSLPAGQAGMPYPTPGMLAQLISGGTPPYTSVGSPVPSVTGLPAGLLVDQNGNVSGTINDQAPTFYSLSVTAMDSVGASAPPGSQSQLQVYCGDPNTHGDDRDSLIAEYFVDNVVVYPGSSSTWPFPRCNDLTQQESRVNVGTVNKLSWWMVWSAEIPFLNAWQNNLAASGAGSRQISSGYRTPFDNAATPAAANHSQHMFGKAIDLQTTSSLQDYVRVRNAANQAAISLGIATLIFIEPWKAPYTCRPGHSLCVHADVRNTPGDYLNP